MIYGHQSFLSLMSIFSLCEVSKKYVILSVKLFDKEHVTYENYGW